MKKFIRPLFLTLLIMLAFNGFSQSVAGDKILGTYWSPKKDAKIEIYKKGTHYFGKTIWVATPRKDTQNPDQQMRKRDLLGVDLLTDFSFDDGSYVDGEIYDPQNGKTYSCKITFSGRNLKVRGFIGISLFGRTEVFERVL